MGTTAEKLTYLNTTKGKIKDSINLTGAGITTEPFRQYAVKLKDAYVDIINNGTETLYNNFPKVSGSGTDLSLQNTYDAPMQIDLKGNTSQVQLSGKNKFNYENTSNYVNSGNSSLTKIDNGIRISTQSAGINRFASVKLGEYSNFSGKTITISGIITPSSTNDARWQLWYMNSSNGLISQIDNPSASSFTKTLTTSPPTNTYYLALVFYNNRSVSVAGATTDFTFIQIEEGSTATTYEQYCGGTPSPNPSYPQDIHNVSGNNTITISDGESDTTTYPINLGSIELFKIGTYQDYIYKENDKWYLHKEIGKIVFDGSESWDYNNSGVSGGKMLSTLINDMPSGNYLDGICNYFINEKSGKDFNSIRFGANNKYIYIYIYETDYPSKESFTTWLSTHNTIVYYLLATPTNTEITDTTLLSQLEAIYNAKSKNGTTNINQENNDLPFIITASALEKEV